MTQIKSTKRALLASVLSIAVCLTMLIGSTFAWFTDSVTTGVNKIQAGTLDIELWEATYTDENTFTEVNISESNTPVFTGELWEPGYLDFTNLTVKNVGNLAVKIKANIVPVGEVGKLAEVIDVYVVTYPLMAAEYEAWGTPSKFNVRDLINGFEFTPYITSMGSDYYAKRVTYLGTLKEVIENQTNLMDEQIIQAGKDSKGRYNNYQINIALKMQETAGNDYQGKTAGDFDIRVLATQASYESDSVNNQYDKNATYADDAWDGSVSDDYKAPAKNETATVIIKTAEELAAFANDVNVNGNDYENATVELAADLDLMNIDWTPIGQTGATQFRGVFDGKGHTIYNLTVDSSNETGAYYSSGLFGWLEQGSPAVKNLTVDGADITGHHNVAVIAGYAYGTIENCHIKNATIVNTHANGDACGDKTGLIAGYVGEDAAIKNCTVADSSITVDGRDAGQIAGAAKAACVTDCSAENVTVTMVSNVTCDHSSIASGGNVRNEVIGRVL